MFQAMIRSGWNVVRAMLVTAGRPVLRRALAFWTAVGVVATIIFAGNGMRARDLTCLFHAGVGARAVLGVAWVSVATPVVACAFDAPGTRTLRTLPVRRGVWVGLLGILALVVQAPCGVLFARADGPLTALVEMLLAVAIEVAVVAVTRKARYALVAIAAIALVILDARPTLALAPAAGLAAASIAGAWRVAFDRSGRDMRLTWRMSPVLVLTIAHLLRMVRVARARVALATGSAAVGALALGLSLRNDPPARPLGRVLAVLALPITLCAAVLVDPVRETEYHVRALARVTRTRWTTLLAAFALALTTPSAALAATAATIAGAFAHVPPLPLGGAASAWAAPIACAIAAWAYWHDRRPQRSPVLFVVGIFVVAMLATGVGAAW
jgi:hypothetical protein